MEYLIANWNRGQCIISNPSYKILNNSHTDDFFFKIDITGCIDSMF